MVTFVLPQVDARAMQNQYDATSTHTTDDQLPSDVHCDVVVIVVCASEG